MSSRRPLSKAEKSLFVLCALVIVPLGAVAYLSEERDVEPDWNIPVAAPRPKPNGYDLYVAAAKATVRFTPEVDMASDTHYPQVPDPLNSPYARANYSLARRKAWLRANAQTFALVNQGLRTSSMAPDIPMGMNRDWGHLRQLARDLSARTRTLQMERQPYLATQSALDGIQMGQDVSRGGDLMARLVGLAVIAIERRPLDDFDKTINRLNAKEARTGARRLERLLTQEPTPTQTLQEEKRVHSAQMRQMLSQPNWRDLLKPFDMPSENPLDTLQRQTVSKRALYESTLRTTDAVISNSRLPYSQAIMAHIPEDFPSITGNFGSSLSGIIKDDARAATSNNMLLLRLALRAYIAEHGQAPPALSALVPSVLKNPIPTDVYNDGKPLFYQAHGATYRLWSVGPDMKNDGGIPFPPRSPGMVKSPAMNTLDNKGDFVAGLNR